MTGVRIRGIYATALTRRLAAADGAPPVVDPSAAIADRFDADFGAGPPDATIGMSPDRQGIAIAGDAALVADLRERVADLAIDVFSWADPAAPGAVFTGEVVDTTGRGAIVDLDGDREGFLPFDAADDYVDVGDELRVQVDEPRPPWTRGRPALHTGLVVQDTVATLVHGVDSLVADTPDGSSDHELVRTTELLSTRVPDEWGIRWEAGAEGLGVADLDAALSRSVDRAESLRKGLDAADVDEPGPLAAPTALVWVWFGREARFALDELRREVVATLPGHHRVKAGSAGAGVAVDFAERLGATALDGVTGDGAVDDFPFGPVTELFGPAVGDRVAIEHGKPDGRCVTLGRGEVVDRDVEAGRITVERAMTAGGTYDALDVPRAAGDVATTRFVEGRWWYPTVYRDEDGHVKGTYVNVSTPIECFPGAVRYVDLHVDVLEHADGAVEIVDEDELRASVEAGHVAEPLADRAMAVAERLADALEP